jgi:phospholipase C
MSIQHIFVLMLENRSFDHMLGFSAIQGTDAFANTATRINGLTGSESNTFQGKTYTVTHLADNVMPVDPHHEFTDILCQLCGPNAKYTSGGTYPPVDDSGFAASYAASGGSADPLEIMKCFDPGQLPVLNALACEFVVCDNWHASIPGPTWPNRLFAHGASSGGLDHSPTTLEIIEWETINHFAFPKGSIFDALHAKGVRRRLYAGDDFPMVASLRNLSLTDIRHYASFAGDLAEGPFDYSYVFIEPSYDVLRDYKAGTSQHPLADITRGESLIKATYEAIRNSEVWDSSLLIITWDENGGFYDHAIPPAAVAPGDTTPAAKYNRNGFTFEQYGPRVPAVIASPLIPGNLIDHRLYDHASIPATIEAVFGLNALTARDARANKLSDLVTLTEPRDTPAVLPNPGSSLSADTPMPSLAAVPPSLDAVPVTRPAESADQGTVPGVLHSALRQDLQISPGKKKEILARVETIKTRAQAMEYLREVQRKVRTARSEASRSQANK